MSYFLKYKVIIVSLLTFLISAISVFAVPNAPTLQFPADDPTWNTNLISSGSVNFSWQTGNTVGDPNIWFYFYLIRWDTTLNNGNGGWKVVSSEYTETNTYVTKLLADDFYAWQVAAVDLSLNFDPTQMWYKWAGSWNRFRVKGGTSTPTPSPTPTSGTSPTPTSGTSPTPSPSPCPTCPIYYISPNGSDTNSGTAPSAPWKTFNKAIPQLDPGETLILLDGIYTKSTTGLPVINCTAGAKNGTSAKPITIKAQNERKALIYGDGTADSFFMTNCSYWNIEGIASRSTDYNNLSSLD